MAIDLTPPGGVGEFSCEALPLKPGSYYVLPAGNRLADLALIRPLRYSVALDLCEGGRATLSWYRTDACTRNRENRVALAGWTAQEGEAGSMIAYREPMINYYVRDPERVSAFYREHFGFVETFRIPDTGPPIHVEMTLGTFVVGFAQVDAARSMHGLDLDPGRPRGEIAIWTDDVDAAIEAIRRNGVRVLSEPHDFLVEPPLRAAWVEDPEGNPIQIVCNRSNDRQ